MAEGQQAPFDDGTGKMLKSIGAAVVGAGIWIAATQLEKRAAEEDAVETTQQMKAEIERDMAADAVAQYEIAKRQGDPMQTCVSASTVATLYLQAKDEAAYTRWKAVEQADCARAGAR